MSGPSPRDAGYTLIELLVVLMLAGFIAAAVTGGLAFGTQVWETSERERAESGAAATAQTILREVLASARPRVKDGFASFRGERDSLSFDGDPPRAVSTAGLAHIELTLVHGEGRTRIVFTATPSADSKLSRTATLVDRPGRLRFSYLDASEKAPVWLAVWRDRDRMPDAVAVEESGAHIDASWGRFVARLPIGEDAACRFDPVSAACRRF
jgi:prepilin-type N-terminal cleavage/methylation domain-containing protein